MISRICIFLTLLFVLSFATAQENEQKPSISEQFDALARKSTSYGKYKAMKVSEYYSIKQNVTDSITTQKEIIVDKKQIISNNIKKIDALKKELFTTKNALNQANSQNEFRYFLGMKMKKNVFSLVITTSYIILIILTLFFALKFQRNIEITKKATSNYTSLVKEHEEHKKKSLKRFQEVNRKLQDELNKNWKKETP